jgi:NAD(P)-dependent dehydrogenase (short-subunit alcohol dehydrogenase family)
VDSLPITPHYAERRLAKDKFLNQALRRGYENAAQPVEIAPGYLFFACEDGSYISGQFLHPNGGEIVNG